MAGRPKSHQSRRASRRIRSVGGQPSAPPDQGLACALPCSTGFGRKYRARLFVVRTGRPGSVRRRLAPCVGRRSGANAGTATRTTPLGIRNPRPARHLRRATRQLPGCSLSSCMPACVVVRLDEGQSGPIRRRSDAFPKRCHCPPYGGSRWACSTRIVAASRARSPSSLARGSCDLAATTPARSGGPPRSACAAGPSRPPGHRPTDPANPPVPRPCPARCMTRPDSSSTSLGVTSGITGYPPLAAPLRHPGDEHPQEAGSQTRTRHIDPSVKQLPIASISR